MSEHIPIVRGARGKGPRAKKALRKLRVKGGAPRPAGYWFAKGERRPEQADSQ